MRDNKGVKIQSWDSWHPFRSHEDLTHDRYIFEASMLFLSSCFFLPHDCLMKEQTGTTLQIPCLWWFIWTIFLTVLRTSSLHNNVQAICQICCNFGHCLGLFMLCIWLCSMIVLLLLCFESRPENTDIFKVRYLKESELLQSVSVLDSGTVIKGTANLTTNCILRSVQKVCVHNIVWNVSHTVQTFVFSIDRWADPNSITDSQFSWLPLFLSIIFDKVCWILIDLVQKTDVKLLECVYFWRITNLLFHLNT